MRNSKRRKTIKDYAILGLALAGASVVAVLAMTATVKRAQAVPSYARQTGQPCATCHTAFPELTPFGRRFKLSGYTLGGGDSKLPPIAVMLLPTFTHTGVNQDSPPSPGTSVNDNFILQQASLFYGGQIYGNVGAFIQGTYDRASGHVMLDNTDIRYADTTTIFDKDMIYGVSVNNNPTVQDVWNTTPAWGFPQVSSTLAPQFPIPATTIEGGFAGQVAGAGVYVFWNDMVYAEVSGYRTLSKGALNALGEPDVDSSSAIDGVAPYWRLAIEPHWGDHYLEVGTFGMDMNILPGRVSGFGVDHITDVGFDSQYQYAGDKQSFTLKLTDIYETQRLNSTFAQSGSTNASNWLNSFKANGSWVYDHTYSLSAGYFNVTGSSDAGLYGANSLVNSPNGNGLIFDAAYLPFSHGGPSFWPYANARIGVSYTQYLQVYGGTTNFDGAGHDASGNSTVLLYAWVAF
ncbi:MAG: cytochrome C [Beijerinckiaceae bacterium]|jgi:hypothetical protein